jgi:cobalt-zinc-cadmium efflux system outer membrane protein
MKIRLDTGGRRGWWATAALLLVLLTLAHPARAQGPQINIENPPGASGGPSMVGEPLGSAGIEGGGPAPVTPFSGRVGPMGSHAPVVGLSPPSAPVIAEPVTSRFQPSQVESATVPTYGELEIPSGPEDFGPRDGMTIDAAIETLVANNLALIAARMEIPMAEADVLTASLRNNPIFYADQQLVPYGHYSFLRPGGPQQTDINVNIPVDVGRIRPARTEVFRRAKRVVEAQLQDVIRQQIDNLYTVFIDLVAARLTLQYSQAYLTGTDRLLGIYEARLRGGEIYRADVEVIRTQRDQARIQVREATLAVQKAELAVAQILNYPLNDTARIRVFDIYRDTRALPEPPEALVQRALQSRPDVMAMRLGVQRAQSDITLAKRSAYPPLYVVWQPYTFQNNTYLGVQSAYSWTLGVTANIPLWNRNQGNITRAKINLNQTAVQAQDVERQAVVEVLNAVREFEASRLAFMELERTVVPSARLIRDTAWRRWQIGGETSAAEYFEAQKNYNEVVRNYRDAVIRHRRAMLDLNTAVGERILP